MYKQIHIWYTNFSHPLRSSSYKTILAAYIHWQPTTLRRNRYSIIHRKKSLTITHTPNKKKRHTKECLKVQSRYAIICKLLCSPQYVVQLELTNNFPITKTVITISERFLTLLYNLFYIQNVWRFKSFGIKFWKSATQLPLRESIKSENWL